MTGERAGHAPSAGWPIGLPGERNLASLTFEQQVGAFVAIAVVVRLACAALTPLAFDEALYWRYSKYLDAGYLDHPFMNPLMIRIGTTLFGDTPFGVRVVAVLGGLVATWAIWRAADLFFREKHVGAIAALLFNLSLAGAVGTMLATSDQALILCTSLLLLALAKLSDTGNGAWWLAVGLAFGLGMCAKYTTVFYVPAIYLWLFLIPANRHWFLSFWPWAGALIATIVFLPVLDWNAHHQWASIVYQGRRMHVETLTLKYLVELLGSQLGLATPSILALAVIGLSVVRGRTQQQANALVLLRSAVLPGCAYFAWHALHQRVQGNWPEVIYPPAIIAAAFAVTQASGLAATASQVTLWANRTALPVGVAVASLIYAQCMFGVLPIGKADPTSRLLDYGWPELAASINSAATQQGASAIIGTEYEPVSSQSFYGRGSLPVIQLTQRVRWANEPKPDHKVLSGRLLYVCREPCAKVDRLHQRFATFDYLGSLPRTRDGTQIESYRLYLAAKPLRAVLDPEYAELYGGEQLQ